jgi:hypothetical protein
VPRAYLIGRPTVQCIGPISVLGTFTILFVLASLAALVAIARLRPGLFFLAVNQAVALRAFTGIAEYGQPASQAFLPPTLFTDGQLETAATIFGLSVPITWVFILIPSAPTRVQKPLAAPPKWTLWASAIYFAGFAVAVKTIFFQGYASEGQTRFAYPAGGVEALMMGFLIYELCRRVRDRGLSPTRAFFILLGVAVVTNYSKGSTGLVTGFLVTGAVLFFSTRKRPLQRWIPLAGVFVVITALGLFVRTVRPYLYQQGTDALSSASESLSSVEADRPLTGEGLEERTNGTQLAAHVLECISLYDRGIDRGWRSYYYPILYTFQPQFLLSALGMKRPQEPAWELAEYFTHGGGIFVFGEMYWNGGFLCVIMVTCSICLMAWLVDSRRNSSTTSLLMCCMFIPSLMQGTQYGITYPMRGISNGCIAVIIYWAFSWMRRHAQSRPQPGTTRVQPASAQLLHE